MLDQIKLKGARIRDFLEMNLENTKAALFKINLKPPCGGLQNDSTKSTVWWQGLAVVSSRVKSIKDFRGGTGWCGMSTKSCFGSLQCNSRSGGSGWIEGSGGGNESVSVEEYKMFGGQWNSRTEQWLTTQLHTERKCSELVYWSQVRVFKDRERINIS